MAAVIPVTRGHETRFQTTLSKPWSQRASRYAEQPPKRATAAFKHETSAGLTALATWGRRGCGHQGRAAGLSSQSHRCTRHRFDFQLWELFSGPQDQRLRAATGAKESN